MTSINSLTPLLTESKVARDTDYPGSVSVAEKGPESFFNIADVCSISNNFIKRLLTPFLSLQEEPVYNTASAWPDDAPVVFAHDLGARNREIFAYYAKTQPTRLFYRWDRATGQIEDLGFASALAISEK